MRHVLLAAAAIGLAACSPASAPDDQADDNAQTSAADTTSVADRKPMPAAPDPEAVAGDRIDLRPLTAADLAANPLEGELGCSFTATGGSGPLLVAMGVVQTGKTIFGLVKPGDMVERVGAAGDFGDLTRGLRLGGRGIDVTLDRGAERDDASEQTMHDATLRVDRGDGSRRDYAGSWTCGP
ncbi:MAG: hypothetical protein GW859_08925 [Sphingomonadales bacterium]|nr:hypothetical protein [Sphingomonadales bacterium]